MFLAMAATAFLSLGSTGYCLQGTMADGTRVRPNSVAMNSLPLGTKIRLVKPTSFYGQKNFTVRDRIGYGSQIDFWSSSCAQSRKWGRKQVTIRVVRRPR